LELGSHFYAVVGVRITNSFFYSSHHQQPVYFTPRRQGAKPQRFLGVLFPLCIFA